MVTRTLAAANTALAGAGFAKLKFLIVGEKVLLEGEFVEGSGAKVRALEEHWRAELAAALWKPPVPRPDAG